MLPGVVPPLYRGDLDASTLHLLKIPLVIEMSRGPAGLLSLTPTISDVNSSNRAGVQVGDFISFNGEPALQSCTVS